MTSKEYLHKVWMAPIRLKELEQEEQDIKEDICVTWCRCRGKTWQYVWGTPTGELLRFMVRHCLLSKNLLKDFL